MTNAELIEKIEESDEWVFEDCKEACIRANLERSWEAADGENFEDVVFKAIEILKEIESATEPCYINGIYVCPDFVYTSLEDVDRNYIEYYSDKDLCNMYDDLCEFDEVICKEIIDRASRYNPLLAEAWSDNEKLEKYFGGAWDNLIEKAIEILKTED